MRQRRSRVSEEHTCLTGGGEHCHGMAREVVAIDFDELGGGMCTDRASSNREGTTTSRLDTPVAVLPADVLQLAVGLQAMSTSSTIPEGFRNWLNGVDHTTTPGLCRSNHQHIAAAGRLRSQEDSGMTNADDSQDMITEGHSVVEHSGVTNSEETSGQIPVVGQSPPQHSGLTRPHSDTGKHPGAEQLTVFYAGMVNVYDEVPLDKAQAIMVLAGRAETWAGAFDDTNIVSGSCATQPASRARSPSPQVTTEPECVPNVKWSKAIATKGELPQARKASLARFLERRKDRLRGGPYTSTTHGLSMRLSRAALNSSWLSSSQRQSLSQY